MLCEGLLSGERHYSSSFSEKPCSPLRFPALLWAPLTPCRVHNFPSARAGEAEARPPREHFCVKRCVLGFKTVTFACGRPNRRVAVVLRSSPRAAFQCRRGLAYNTNARVASRSSACAIVRFVYAPALPLLPAASVRLALCGIRFVPI